MITIKNDNYKNHITGSEVERTWQNSFFIQSTRRSCKRRAASSEATCWTASIRSTA